MPILRLFNTTDDAMEAVAELKQFKYGRVGIQVVAQTEDEFSFDSMKRMGVPDGEVPPDVTDYNNDWLTRDLYALREYDAWDRLPEAEKTRRRREADAAG